MEMNIKKASFFLIDTDGVILKGEKIIEGTQKALSLLKDSGAKIMIATNNSTRSRKQLLNFFKKHGIDLKIENILTSGYCAAQYILSKNYKEIYVIGEKGLFEEIRNTGVKIIDENSEKCDAVIIGMDKKINYKKLVTAHKLIKNGADFIATNADATLPLENGDVPGAGALISFLETSTKVKPIILGKPNLYFLEIALSLANESKEKCGIIGDRPETDILMARKAGCLGILVLSGVSTSKRIEDYPEECRPHLIYSNLLEFAEYYSKKDFD
jgi:4-nitrophenyl phosphatase